MKQRNAAGFYSSSLEMLLDTMCNMLGGVVFIALMVAVVAQDSTAHTPEQARQQAAARASELAAVTSSNQFVEAEMRAILLRLQDPQLRPETNVMHLPNVANTLKQPWLVILQRKKLYALDVWSAGTPRIPVLNNREVLFDRHSGYVETRPDQGMEPDESIAQMIDAFKTAAKTNYYFAFWVYDDSFPAFVKAREKVIKSGYQYGWNPLPANERLKVGRQGERVLPQN
jgi:hypothetical protein